MFTGDEFNGEKLIQLTFFDLLIIMSVFPCCITTETPVLIELNNWLNTIDFIFRYLIA